MTHTPPKATPSAQFHTTLFAFLRACIFTDETVEDADWRALYQEMKIHAIAGLAGEWLSRHEIADTELDSAWRKYCQMKEGEWVRYMLAQEDLLTVLDANQIPCVIIKGAASAMNYPVPPHRSMGDVDFLVKRRDFERALRVLRENGFHDGVQGAEHHGVLKKNGVTFEMHVRLARVSENDVGGIARFEEGIDRREMHETEGFRFPTLPVALNGAVLMHHIMQHLASGLGLRQIIDWMVYLNGLSEETWKNEVYPLLCDFGLKTLTHTVTLICERYLGLPKRLPDEGNYPCDELLEFILSSGNFGVKTGFEGSIATVTRGEFYKGHFFGRLQERGLINWKAAQKHKILRPFAWIYQAFRILGMFMRNNVGVGKFFSERKKGRAQKALMDRLGYGE